MRILKALWLLTRTIALSVIVDVSVAAAQTVIVRSAPPGAPIEIQVDGGRTQSVTADANGDATLSVALPSGSTEAAVQVFVDRCEPVVRVQLVRRGVPIPVAAAGCTRGDISGAYLMRSITTFVVDVDQSGGSVHVRQGPPPRSWLSRGELAPGGRETFRWPAANGVTLWAGVGISRDSHAIATICGDATSCSGNGYTAAIAAGATVRLPKIFGVQATIAKRAQAEIDGSGDNYRFTGTVATRLTTLSALAGKSIGPTRIYAQGGLNRHRATFSTTQETDSRTVTVNNGSQTIAGGTQTLQYTTEGWGWLFGGGFEAWATRFVALYVDGQYLKVRGSDVSGGEARTDESLFLLTGGVRIRVGR
jgi:hypothetical protein